MIRKDAIKLAATTIGAQPIISANGFISRDLFESCDRKSNFYMIGSMGLSSSIGLGLALKNPKKKFFVFDGDGNLLMNLGTLVTIGSLGPKNLIHLVFDNGIHESTGGQPTNSGTIPIEKLAKVAKYTVFKTSSIRGLRKILKKIEKIPGPILILVKVEKNGYNSKRVFWSPHKIRDRFREFLFNNSK